MSLNLSPRPVLLPMQDRSIGALLIDAGKLSTSDAEHILRVQKEDGLRFGQAAVKLGFVTEVDISAALSRQFDYPYLTPGESQVSRSVVAAYEPFSSRVEALRALRSQLMLRWFGDEPERKALAVVSAGHGEGRSQLAANLAVVFSQLGEHTLLIDADMRRPTQHTLFGLDNRVGLSSILSGRGDPSAVQRVPELIDLSILPAGSEPPNPQELLNRPLFAQTLGQFCNEFDVVIVDTPAFDAAADAQILSQRCGAALFVARQNRTLMSKAQSLVDALGESGALVLGAVVNEF